MNKSRYYLVCILSTITVCCNSPGDDILYVSNELQHAQIFRLNASAGSSSNISNNPFFDFEPDVSPDGSRIAFVSFRLTTSFDEQKLHIYKVDIDGNNPEQLTLMPAMYLHPRWTPVGHDEIIAFARKDGLSSAKLWTIHPDGSGLDQVTDPPTGQSDELGHDFYLDGKMIIFSRHDYGTNQSDLFTIYFDGTQNFQQITNTPTIREWFPTVSNDGKVMAYAAYDSNSDRYSIRFLEINGWILTNEIAIEPPIVRLYGGRPGSMAFSNDDGRLYFSAIVSDGSILKHEVLSVEVNGVGQLRLTDNSVWDRSPAVIP